MSGIYLFIYFLQQTATFIIQPAECIAQEPCIVPP